MQKLTAVGLGPGDAELITVKGLKRLQRAEVIFYPSTNDSDGKKKSFSLKILEQYRLKAQLIPLFIPMSGDNQYHNYKKAFEHVKSVVESEKEAAIVNEGDLLFYSTFGYILPFFKQVGLPVEIIPGIPAFIDAASKSQTALIEKQQKLTVVPGTSSFQEVKKALQDNEAVVVMKMSTLDQWHRFIDENDYHFFYVEKLGTSEQYCTSELDDLKNRIHPYFSLIILYNHTN